VYHRVSTWFWIAGKREREVLLKSIEHLSKIRDVTLHFNNMLDKIKENDTTGIQEEFNYVDNIEKEADTVKRKLIEDLSKGSFHPIDREDLMRLILSSDDIAAYVKASARKLLLLLDMNYRIPGELLQHMKNMAENVLKAVEILIDAVKELTKSIEKAITLSHLVEEIEEKIDDMRIDTLKTLFMIYGREFRTECMLLKEIIDDLEMASDKCEDVSDIIRTIAVSHT